MSHIHIPDGVLPIGWWFVGYLVAIGILLIALRKLEKEDLRKRVPYLGVISALMLITMSVPVGALPFHINLTILTGILAGPWLGYVSVFMVNLFLSFLGHGGITVVGINTLILASEVVLGWGIFQLLRRWSKDLTAAGIATVIALLISTSLMMGVVGFSQLGWEYALPHDHGQEHGHEHGEDVQLADVDETVHGVDQAVDHVEGVDHAQGEAVEHEEGVSGETEAVSAVGGHSSEAGSTDLATLADNLSKVSFFKLSGLGALVTILLIGIALEVIVTILMVRFFKKVRPDLLG